MATFSDKPWDGSASRWPDTASYCKSCLIDNNPPGTPADKKTQANCHLPVQEPDGAVNKNAVHNAASRLNQTKMSPENKKKAARKLQSLYRQMKEVVPDVIARIAG